MKEIIYYTSNFFREPEICEPVRQQILKANLPIVSCSLKPIDFGKNIVLNLEPGVETMTRQIYEALKNTTADTIFFCEHDVLYHPSHFDFELPSRDKFYYNTNIYRWRYPKNHFVTWGSIRSLSGLCVDRKLALKNYKKRLDFIGKNGWRIKFGFEPGCRKKKVGGITDDDFEDWKSAYPNIDIRHKGTVTPRKCYKTSFVNPPDWNTWREVRANMIPGWDKNFILSIPNEKRFIK